MKLAIFLLGVSGAGKSTLIRHIKQHELSLEGLIKQGVTGGVTTRTFSHDNNFMDFMNREKITQWWSDLDSDADMYRQARTFAVDHADFPKFETENWNECLKADILFIDTMHVSKKARARYLSEAKQKGFTTWGVMVMTPLQILVDRQKTRYDKEVPESVIRDAYMRQQEMLPPSEVDHLFVVNGMKDPVLLPVIHV